MMAILKLEDDQGHLEHLVQVPSAHDHDNDLILEPLLSVHKTTPQNWLR